MITNEIFCRVFRIRYKGKCGTCFTVDKEDIQYIVTAKHLFNGVKQRDTVVVEVLIEKTYVPLTATVTFHNDDNVDCAVLKTNPYHEITGKYLNENTINGITFGQDVYFLGFPYNYDDLLMCFPNSTTPVPFIKKACFSGLSGDGRLLFLDGINNPGFSGGPVCFKDSKTNKYKIAGLVNSYRYNKNPVYSDSGIATNLYVEENTGIIYACSIQEALTIIDCIN